MQHRASACRVWPLAPGGGLRFTVRASAPTACDAVDRAWDLMRARNERLFDGLFLCVEEWTPPAPGDRVAGTLRPGHFACRVERYRHLAVAPFVAEAAHVRVLALTGITTARDERGVDHVLMGLRAAKTRMYGGLWEFAPAGGIDPPQDQRDFDAAALRSVLAHELEEEVGLPAESLGRCEPILVVLNEEARSYDVVVRTPLLIGLEEARRRSVRGSWEYERTEWVPVRDVGAFVAEHGIVPHGREMVEHAAR